MGKHEIKIPLTEKEYQTLSKAWDKSFEALKAMTPQERKDWYMDRYNERFEFGEYIGDTLYIVNTFFNPNAKEAIFDKIVRLIEQEEK